MRQATIKETKGSQFVNAFFITFASKTIQIKGHHCEENQMILRFSRGWSWAYIFFIKDVDQS